MVFPSPTLLLAAIACHGPLASAEIHMREAISELTPGRNIIANQLAAPPKYESVWARVRRDINTECKTCPYQACTNQDWYQSSFQFLAVCYAKGSMVNSTK
jgi:hypothetical protein